MKMFSCLLVLVFCVTGASATELRAAGPPAAAPALRTLGLSSPASVPAAASLIALYAQAPPQQQDEFVPIDELPPQDQLPAAPLLVAAYSFVALALFAYVVSVARRLTSVQKELERLESDWRRSGRR